MADKNITLAADVLALVKQRAAAAGVPEDEVATEAVRIGLEEGRWRALSRRRVAMAMSLDTPKTTCRT